MIDEVTKARFMALLDAAAGGRVCVASATRRSDGEAVNVICVVRPIEDPEDDQDLQFIPVAVMIEGNPYDAYAPAAGLFADDPGALMAPGSETPQ